MSLRGVARLEPWIAAAGGMLALAASMLLPFHLGGGFGTWITAGFLTGGVLLGMASIAFAMRFPREGARMLRNWAVLGAAGFAVGGAGLLADVVERPIVTAEIVAVVAVAVWWGAVWKRLEGESVGRWFGRFSLLCAASALAAFVGQLVWEPPAGAVPVRFAYVLWGPWALWLAVDLVRRPRRQGR